MTTSFLAVKEDSQANNEDSALTLHSQTIDGKLDEKFDEGLFLPTDFDADTTLLNENELTVIDSNNNNKKQGIPNELYELYVKVGGKLSNDVSVSNGVASPSNIGFKGHTIINPQTRATGASISVDYGGFPVTNQYPAYKSNSNIEMTPEPGPNMSRSLISAGPIPEDTPLKTVNESSKNRSRKSSNLLTVDAAKNIKSNNNNSNDDDIKDDSKVLSNKDIKDSLKLLTEQVIQMKQELYVKDTIIKNLFLRLQEFNHISHPRLKIERVVVVKNDDIKSNNINSGNNKNKKSKGNNNDNNNDNNNCVSLNITMRWLPRYNLMFAIQKGLISKQSIFNNDLIMNEDTLTRQMFLDWRDYLDKNETTNIHKLNKINADKQIKKYLMHDRVGKIRVDILKGKNYENIKKIEQNYSSLIIKVQNIPKHPMIHVVCRVFNPSSNVWGPLSNIITINTLQ